jgi:hypothetical protein
MSEKPNGVKIFIAYSHQDETLKKRLEVHLTILKHQGYISSWNDWGVVPGEIWSYRIKNEMETADIILLLVSPDFLNSGYLFDVILKNVVNLHQVGESVIVPIIFTKCDWQSIELFSKLRVLPEKGIPVDDKDQWFTQDEAFTTVIKELKITTRDILNKNKPPDGPLKPGSHIYIERPADKQLELLLEPRSPSTMYLIIGGIQCGKTSLLREFKANAQKKNFPTIHVDFQRLSNTENLTAGKVFDYIFQTIGEAKISRKIDKAPEKKDDKGDILWTKEMLLEYLKKNLETGEKTFLIIDSMDSLLSQSQEQDTLNELILWLHMLRTSQAKKPLDRLTIIAAMTTLSYSAVYSSPLRTKAANIPVGNFGHTEIENLLGIYGIETDIKQIAGQIFELFGGQPHLSHLAVYDLYQGSKFPEIRENAFKLISGYRDYWLNIKRMVELVLKIKAYDKIVAEVFMSLSSENQTPTDYRVVQKLFDELFQLGIIGMNHELSSDFIKNAIRKEIEIK